jgi:hypothetical protein
MNVLVLAALTDATGNAVTARRIARLLERSHRVHLVDSVGATRKSVQDVIEREHVDLAIGVHALLAGPFPPAHAARCRTSSCSAAPISTSRWKRSRPRR